MKCKSIVRRVAICICVVGVVIGIRGAITSNAHSTDNKYKKESIEVELMGVVSADSSLEALKTATFNTDFFKEKSFKYNDELATFSCNLINSAAAIVESYKKYGESLSDISYVDNQNISKNNSRNAYLTKAYQDMGFTNDIKIVLNNALGKSKEIIDIIQPLDDSKYCGKSHQLEFYIAYMNNYDLSK